MTKNLTPTRGSMIRLLARACGFLLFPLALRGAATEWPQFRGPTAQGISEATDVPTEWNINKNVAWKIEIPGKGWSSPAVSDGKVYLTTAAGPNGAPTSLWAICIDATTGKVVWDTQVFQPDQSALKAIHGKNSPASPTPIITADRVYVHFGHMGTAALDHSGKIVWRQNSIKYSPVHGNGGSPALYKDELIFSCDGGSKPFVTAISAQTGEVKWMTPRDTRAHKPFSFCTPLLIELDGTTQAIIPGSGFVGGYDPANGHEIWRVRYGEGYSVVPRPIFADGLLFLGSGFDSPVTYAINPTGAKGDATDTNVAWTQRKRAPLTPSMLAVGDDLYTISDDGFVTCADTKTGNVIWQERLAGNFSASPVLAEGRIYFQSEEGVGYVIKAAKTFAVISQNDLGERSLASDAIIDHAIFIRTASHLWKIAKK